MFEFPNGYAASVVQFAYSYGGDQGLWELAVLDDDGLTFDTPITDNVLGYLEWEAVETILDAIEALPIRAEQVPL